MTLPDDYTLCDTCGGFIVPPDRALVTPFGSFCGDDCAVDAEATFYTYMDRHGYTACQPDLLAAAQEDK